MAHGLKRADTACASGEERPNAEDEGSPGHRSEQHQRAVTPGTTISRGPLEDELHRQRQQVIPLACADRISSRLNPKLWWPRRAAGEPNRDQRQYDRRRVDQQVLGI